MLNLTQHPELTIRQGIEEMEIGTGIETENRYLVQTPEGRTVAHVFERSGFASRQFLRSHRALRLEIYDGESRELAAVASRRFFWFFAHLHVADAAGTPVGSLQQRWGFFERRFDLTTPMGVIGRLRGPWLRRNTFMLNTSAAGEVARITKLWGGILREGFTEADTFSLEFHGSALSDAERLVALAAAFAIDIEYFEQGKGLRGYRGGRPTTGTGGIAGGSMGDLGGGRRHGGPFGGFGGRGGPGSGGIV